MAQVARCWVLALILLGMPKPQGVAQVAHQEKTQNSEDFVLEIQPLEITAGETAVLHWSLKGVKQR